MVTQIKRKKFAKKFVVCLRFFGLAEKNRRLSIKLMFKRFYREIVLVQNIFEKIKHFVLNYKLKINARKRHI
jgi:hypothetical protein